MTVEKMYEELTTDEEVARPREFDELIVVIPSYRNIYGNIDYSEYERTGKLMDRVYRSHHEAAMSHEEIETFLGALGIFDVGTDTAFEDSSKERNSKGTVPGFAEAPAS